MASVEVFLLGPPRVVRDGAPVAFDTRKAVALLALLALTDRPRSRDAIAELLWPEHDAEHARGALRRTLSTLRSAIGAERLEATRDRVALRPEAGLDLDVDRFRALAADGAAPEEAAALFGGEFLEGFGLRDSPGFEDWQRGEADALRRELGVVLARAVDGRLAAGDFGGGIAHARRWLELDALHEPAHRQLIRLYALSGDRAAALAQYRDCVRALSRELGVPPLEETTALYQAISEGTLAPPAPPVAPPVPSSSKPAGSPLVGRDEDWRALHDAHARVGPDGGVALVEGEPGIGKTRLVEELLAHLRGRGAMALVGRCYEDEGSLAYGPLVEALRHRLRSDAGWLAGVPDRALREAARLLPELSEHRPGLSPATPADEPGAEARFLDGVCDTLAAAASGPAPGVLFVDNAQWADEATLGLLGYLTRRLRGRPLLVLVAWRLPHEHPLAPALATNATVRRLQRLTAEQVGELVDASGTPAVDADLRRRLFEETEGLPFLLVEYLSALGGAAGASEEGWALPAGAREVMRSRLGPVSQAGRQVLSAAAVIGRSFDVETVRAASGRGDEETVGALEELVRLGLVREVGRRGTSDYDFEHEKLRGLVYEETSLARRRLLHGRAADALAGRGREPGARSALVARHLQLAGRDREAAEAHVLAAEHARALYAHADALAHLRAALALGHPDRAALHAAVGDLQTLTGDYPAALTSYETAAADAPPGELASLEQRLGSVHHRRGDWTLAQAHFRAALAAADDADPGARARIQADLSLSALDGGDPPAAAELAGRARELAECAGDPLALARSHNLLGLLATGDGALDEALVHLERSLGFAEEADDGTARVAALNNLAFVHRARGELDRALALTRSALRLCAEQGDRHHEAALHNNVADLLHAAGRPDEAMDELKRAVAIFTEIGAEEAPQPEVWKLARW